MEGLGYIYITKEQARHEYSVKRITKSVLGRIQKYFKGEIQEYEYYINGQTYGYIVEDEEGIEIDSCWGFYGSDIEKNGMLDSLSEYKEHITERYICGDERMEFQISA